jgi:hypothetical protein
MYPRRFITAFSAVLLVAACTGSSDDDPSPGDDDDDGVGVWAPIVTGNWTLDPYSEITSDIHTVTLDRDYYISGIRPIAPPGTHHTVLALDPGAFSNIVYASGVGTGELMFPPGVGLHLTAGETLYLQLHLFNVDAAPLTGTSGIEVFEMDASELVQEADVFLPGPFDLNILPSQISTMSDVCNVNQEMNLFAVIPHMHQLGTHFKLTANVSGSDITLHDADYSFSSQSVDPFESVVSLQNGDSLGIECTWNNTSANPVGWGESSETEMCFAILFRYPAQGTEFCTQHP